MNKNYIKEKILQRKFSILIIILLLVWIVILFSKNQELSFELIYGYQSVPDIELENTLQESQGEFSGEIVGFVKFNESKDQPKDLKQYYIIKPISPEKFLVEEILKLPSISARKTSTFELNKVSESDKLITLEDEYKNKFFINKVTKEISMKDATGDNSMLITDDTVYEKFILEWLKK